MTRVAEAGSSLGSSGSPSVAKNNRSKLVLSGGNGYNFRRGSSLALFIIYYLLLMIADLG